MDKDAALDEAMEPARHGGWVSDKEYWEYPMDKEFIKRVVRKAKIFYYKQLEKNECIPTECGTCGFIDVKDVDICPHCLSSDWLAIE